jgi:hypothetical protein
MTELRLEWCCSKRGNAEPNVPFENVKSGWVMGIGSDGTTIDSSKRFIEAFVAVSYENPTCTG